VGWDLNISESLTMSSLAKWKWRLLTEEKGKWKDWLVSKYGMDLGNNLTHSNF